MTSHDLPAERGLLMSQAFVESLRYYPSRAEGDLNRDCEVRGGRPWPTCG